MRRCRPPGAGVPWSWSCCRPLFQSVAKHWLARRQLGEPAFHLPLTHQVQQCPIDLPFAAAQGQDQLGMEEPSPRGLAQKPQQHVSAIARADDALRTRIAAPLPSSCCRPSNWPAIQSMQFKRGHLLGFACRRGSSSRPFFPRWSSFKNPESAWH